MWLQFKITCLHYHKSFLKFSGVGIYQSTNLHSFLCFLKYKSNTTKIHFLSIQFDKFGQTVLLVKAGFGIFSICVSVSTKWLLLWKTEARPNTKYISTHPLQGEGTQGVPVRFLAVLKYLLFAHSQTFLCPVLLVRILWLHYPIIKMFSICQCLHQIPASPWSPF